MDKTITVKFDEERLKALKKYLKRKANSTVEQELEYALTRLPVRQKCHRTAGNHARVERTGRGGRVRGAGI